MSTEENKNQHLRFYNLFNRGDWNGIREMLAPNVVDHDAQPGQAAGAEGVMQVLQLFKNAFPDMEITVEDLLAEGDLVVDRVSAQGTQTGAMLGIPPTNKAVHLQAINTHRYADGKVAELWHLEDNFGMLVQLGVVPPPPNPETTD